MAPKLKLKEYIRKLNHHKHFRLAATSAIVTFLPGVGAYSCLVAPKRLKTERISLKLSHRFPKLKGLKIAQISDLHYGPTNCDENFFRKVVQIINQQKPDLIALTGDYYQWDPEYLEGLPKILENLEASLGVYGVLGNHDYGACYPGALACDPFDHETIEKAFGKHGIKILANESASLNYNDQEIQLAGLHDLWSGHFDPEKTMGCFDSDKPTIVLSHNPDTAEMVKPDYDLMLSGHAHGGQLTLPWIGSLIAPVKNKKYTRGLHEISGRKNLYVNRGLGYTFKLRWNSLPEISIIEIK
jgi:predicted MPP superfamily phosphohydrolase